MGDFDKAMELIFRNEGVYVNDPVDRGGATKYGISKNFLKQIGDDRNPANLTQDDALELYREHFWDAISGDDLPDPLAAIFLDLVVNHGIAGGVKIMQRALSFMGANLGPAGIDGALGPATLEAVQEIGDRYGQVFLGVVLKYRQELYEYLVTKNPTQAKFANGWKNRVRRCAFFVAQGIVE